MPTISISPEEPSGIGFVPSIRLAERIAVREKLLRHVFDRTIATFGVSLFSASA